MDTSKEASKQPCIAGLLGCAAISALVLLYFVFLLVYPQESPAAIKLFDEWAKNNITFRDFAFVVVMAFALSLFVDVANGLQTLTTELEAIREELKHLRPPQ
jgi:hypothetical protein